MLEFNIPAHTNHELKVRRRKMGDIELRLWFNGTGYSRSLQSGFFLPFSSLDRLIEVLQKIKEGEDMRDEFPEE